MDPLDLRQGGPPGRRRGARLSGGREGRRRLRADRRTGGWIVEHLNGLRILGVVVAALFLVFGGTRNGVAAS